MHALPATRQLHAHRRKPATNDHRQRASDGDKAPVAPRIIDPPLRYILNYARQIKLIVTSINPNLIYSLEFHLEPSILPFFFHSPRCNKKISFHTNLTIYARNFFLDYDFQRVRTKKKFFSRNYFPVFFLTRL